jgi:enoyl-CoA hydratase/carnithine racemase
VSLITQKIADGVAVLTLNRPERRNALSTGLIDALCDALDAVAADNSVRVVILTGAGKGFCSGGDLADGMKGDGFMASHQSRGRFGQLMARIPALKVPVIAAVHGNALGGGCGLAMACDLVVADADARLGTPEIKLGLFPWIILAALQRDVPRKPLMEMVLTGQKLDAQTACRLGMVNRVAPAGTVLDVAGELAAEIASRSPLVVAMGKAAFYQIADQPYEDALAYMHGQLSLNLLTDDAMEGVAAFLQRREPEWKGR